MGRASPPRDGLLTLSQAASALGKAMSTLRRWYDEKRMRVVKVLGNVYVTPDEVDRLMTFPELPPKLEE